MFGNAYTRFETSQLMRPGFSMHFTLIETVAPVHDARASPEMLHPGRNLHRVVIAGTLENAKREIGRYGHPRSSTTSGDLCSLA